MPVIEAVGLTVDRVMLATGFAASSAAATRYAKALAKRFSSKLMVAHVIDISAAAGPENVVGRPVDWMRQASGENFVRLVDELSAAGIHSSSHTMEDSNLAGAVIRLARRLDADLIVTGTSSRRGADRFILGSCAEGILRNAECPVLCVGPHARDVAEEALRFEAIVFATDFSANAMEQAALACAFARDSRAKLYLCHIVEDDAGPAAGRLAIQAQAEAALSRLVPDASCEWVDPEFVVEHGKAAEKILGVAARVKADLVVLGARRSSFLGTHMVQGVVGNVLAKALCPVMTVRAPVVEVPARS